jgi:hypothetical protein
MTVDAGLTAGYTQVSTVIIAGFREAESGTSTYWFVPLK